MAERFYSGRDDHVVVREGELSRLLDLRLDLDPGGSTQLVWGHDRSARLAIALVADALDNDSMAVNLAPRFTARVVAMLPPRWTMSRARILSYLELIQRETLT